METERLAGAIVSESLAKAMETLIIHGGPPHSFDPNAFTGLRALLNGTQPYGTAMRLPIQGAWGPTGEYRHGMALGNGDVVHVDGAFCGGVSHHSGWEVDTE